MEKEFKYFEFNQKEFTKRLISFREKEDWSVREVAKSIGVSPAAYLKYEFGRAIPSAVAFHNICKLMNLAPDKFFVTHKPSKDEKQDKKFKL